MTTHYTGAVPLDGEQFTRAALAGLVGQRPRMLAEGNYMRVLGNTTITAATQSGNVLHLTFTIDEVSPDEWDASLTQPPPAKGPEAHPRLAVGFRVEGGLPDTTSPDDRPIDSALVMTLWWDRAEPSAMQENIYPPSLWLRSIEFLDAQADNGLRVPVHMTNRVRFNGVDVDMSVPIAKHEPVVVYTKGGLGETETIVSLVVHRSALGIPPLDEQGVPLEAGDATFRVGKHNVLAPRDPALMWQPARAEDGDWWRVWVLVAEVAFLGSRE